MAGTRTELACLKAAIAALGPAPEPYDPVYWIKRRVLEARQDMGEERWQQLNAEWDESPFADARRHLASLSPERHAQLQAEWDA